MSEDRIVRMRICPICGKPYHHSPAVSREDPEQMICPDCGTRQALTSMGVGEEEQEKILAIIHQYTRS